MVINHTTALIVIPVVLHKCDPEKNPILNAYAREKPGSAVWAAVK